MEASNLEVGLTQDGPLGTQVPEQKEGMRVHGYVGARTHEHACIQARADDKVPAQLPSLSTYIFETVSLALDLIGLARPSSQ